MNNKKFNAAVIGGGVGGRVSLSALHASNKFDLVAACDLNPNTCKNLETDFPGIKTYTNHKKMFSSYPVDIICVSTFAPSHEQIATEAMNVLPLKGILMEKPLGDTYASAKRLLQEIKKRNLPVAVPHGMLQQKSTTEILHLVKSGAIGKLNLVEIQCSKWDIINAGIHWLNYFVSLICPEKVDYVMALCETSSRTYRDGMQVETTAITYAQTTSGIRMIMNTGDDVMTSPEFSGISYRLAGSGGQIVFGGWCDKYFMQNREYPEMTEIITGKFQESTHQRHLEEMAQMIETGKTDYSVAESSLAALELVEAAYLSSEHHCKVCLPLDKFIIPEPVEWQPGQPYSGKGGGRNGRKL